MSLAVLLVEDNLPAAKMMERVLRAFGYQPRVAHDGHAALRAVAEGMPDVAILDIGLPGLDGWAVASRIREIPAPRRPLLIAVTGYGSAEDKAKSEKAGIDLHLTKPADLTVLQSVLVEFEREQGAT